MPAASLRGLGAGSSVAEEYVERGLGTVGTASVAGLGVGLGRASSTCFLCASQRVWASAYCRSHSSRCVS